MGLGPHISLFRAIYHPQPSDCYDESVCAKSDDSSFTCSEDSKDKPEFTNG